jgi:transcription initiation factor TFIID subunit TAF12
MKLEIEILTQQDPVPLLRLLATEKLHAQDIHKIEESNTINIDAGMNDIRAEIDENVIKFYCRYKKDADKYEKHILDFCKEHSLTLRFQIQK